MTVRLARMVHMAVLAIWALLPLLLVDEPPVDLLPSIVAGELAADDLEDVYIDDAAEVAEPPPAFVRAHCEQAATYFDADECAAWALPFVGPPPVLAASMGLSGLDARAAALLVRSVGVACFAVGAHVMWRRLARHGLRGAVTAAATTLALTPAVLFTTRLGQTTPVVFLLGALGLTALDRPGRRVVGAGVLLAAIAWKLFPAAVLWVPVAERRWRYLATAAALAAGVVLATALVVPLEAWGQYWAASAAFDDFTHHLRDNAAVDAVLAQELDVRVAGPTRLVSLGLRVALLAALGWWGLRRAGTDARWAWSIAASLLVAPLLWSHYAVLVVPALAAALAEAGTRVGRLDPVRWAVLPLVALGCSAFVDGPTLPRLALVLVATVMSVRLLRLEAPAPAGPPSVAVAAGTR